MSGRAAALAALSLSLGPLIGGCDLTMYRQPKYNAQAPASTLPADTDSQTPPEGTVAEGALGQEDASATPPTVTPALLQRGKERYEIYCKPCHGVSGDGNGTIVARGFPHPPDYASQQVRSLTGAQIFGVITRGYGIMFPYGDRVEPADRWAIVSYVRALEAARSLGAVPVPPPPGSYGGQH